VKLIWHLHEIVENPHILKGFIAYLISKADTVIAVSKATQTFWNNAHKKINAQLLYNGIDTNKFSNGQWPAGPLTIGMIGRIQKWKGQDYLLEIIEEYNKLSGVKEVKVLLAGDAYPGYEYLETELKDSIRKKGLDNQVNYLGYQANVPALLNQIHLLILPSTSPDPLPTVVLEAMAAGKPVLATKQGGATEMIIENETGVFIPLNNAKEAAIILQRTIIDEAKLKAMGTAGLQRVQEEFSKDAFAKNWKLKVTPLKTTPQN
jgi:glycosyltransferase involved in cell wall biosynthesis